MIDQLEAEMREGKVDYDNARPSLLGFDTVASGFHNLTNHIIALRAEQSSNGKLKMMKGPVFPTDIVEKRLREHADKRRANALERAQERWRKNHG